MNLNESVIAYDLRYRYYEISASSNISNDMKCQIFSCFLLAESVCLFTEIEINLVILSIKNGFRLE